MGEMCNNDSVSKELALRPYLCCKDLVSMQHIVLLDVTPLRQINLLLGSLTSSRDRERHVVRGPIWMSPLCNEIPRLPLC